MGDPFQIRPARVADAAALRALELRCFSDPWTADGFREMLQSPGIFGLVAEGAGGLAGYLVARWVEDEGEILNLAVAPEQRRHGVARTLLEAGLEVLAGHGIRRVFLEVRASNRPATDLYLARGFLPLGRRKGYYRNPVEDAMVLALEGLTEAGRTAPPD